MKYACNVFLFFKFLTVTFTFLIHIRILLSILITFWSFFAHFGGFRKIKKLIHDGGPKMTVLSCVYMPGSFLKLNTWQSGFGELSRFEIESTLSLRNT